jgi:hypothetical protein
MPRPRFGRKLSVKRLARSNEPDQANYSGKHGANYDFNDREHFFLQRGDGEPN